MRKDTFAISGAGYTRTRERFHQKRNFYIFTADLTCSDEGIAMLLELSGVCERNPVIYHTAWYILKNFVQDPDD